MKMPIREITYLVGDCAEKRRLMRVGGVSLARAMNDEVSAICRMGGKDYYVIGKHPFSSFTVWQYMRYERALLSPVPLTKTSAKELLKKAGLHISLSKRLGSLSVVKRRLVTVLSRITDSTSSVALSLDGVPYSMRLKRQLRRASAKLRKTYGLYVAVTDSRFAVKGNGVEIRPNTLFVRSRKKYRSGVVRRASLIEGLKARFAEPPVIEKGMGVCVKEVH